MLLVLKTGINPFIKQSKQYCVCTCISSPSFLQSALLPDSSSQMESHVLHKGSVTREDPWLQRH